MNHANQTIDISVLPVKVREELIDFYHFLVEKYGSYKAEEAGSVDSKLPEEFYKPIRVKRYLHFDREEIYRDV